MKIDSVKLHTLQKNTMSGTYTDHAAEEGCACRGL